MIDRNMCRTLPQPSLARRRGQSLKPIRPHGSFKESWELFENNCLRRSIHRRGYSSTLPNTRNSALRSTNIHFDSSRSNQTSRTVSSSALSGVTILDMSIVNDVAESDQEMVDVSSSGCLFLKVCIYPSITGTTLTSLMRQHEILSPVVVGHILPHSSGLPKCHWSDTVSYLACWTSSRPLRKSVTLGKQDPQ